jgi:signal transduction histidine kinase/CheY-like chemotaxis protein
MVSSFFSSVGLSVGCSVFVFTVAVMYFLKNKNNKTKITNKAFVFLIGITMWLGLTELLVTLSLSRTTEPTFINNFACRQFTGLGWLWNLAFLSYIYITMKRTTNEEFRLQTKHWILIAIFAIIGVVIVFLLPVEYTSGVNNDPFVIVGPLLYFTVITNTLTNLIGLTAFAVYKNRIKNIFLTPIVFIMVSNIVMTIGAIATNTFINDKIAFYAITVVLLYLTIESQDNKLIEEYNKSREEAIIANKAKNEFLINMSHEIRTPMNTILGFGQSLLADQTLTEEVARRDIKNISEASETLMDLINNILDISKLESGEVTLNEADYLLESLIFELNSLIPSKINKEELRFTIDINNEIPREYHGDAYKVFKVASYILLNAIEYTNYGEVKLTIDGKVLPNNEFELLLLVSNTGHAMTDEIFRRGFEDFVKIENASQNNVDTIKLGLIIAKQLIAMLGGTIEFVNKKGEGTKYYVRIKQRIVNPEKIGNIFESREGHVSSSKDIKNCAGLRALIVDDSDINLKLASRYLQQFNFTVTTALSGKEAIELSKTTDFDVMFIDHMMPEMDGVETVKALIATGRKIPPIVALTANSYEGIREEFKQKGFADYLQKPINFKELSKIINNIFGKDN